MEVTVVPVTVETHPNADALEIARVGDYQSLVRKGQFLTGDLVAYIPEGSMLPLDLVEQMGLNGRLFGPDKNRVKAIRLRGTLSQGLCLAADPAWVDGQDVMELLGITKYESDIPTCLAGNVWFATTKRTLPYDVKNIKASPNALEDGEIVVIKEKIHGTCFISGAVMNPDPVEGDLIVQSKGLGGKGLAMKINDPINDTNLYVRTSREYNLHEITRMERDERGLNVYVIGEIFGHGVQDLQYGAHNGTRVEGFRVFDVFVGTPTTPDARFLNDAELTAFCERHNLRSAPLLYRGPYSKEIMLAHTDGLETVSGTSSHMREGVVVRPLVERYDKRLGRIQFKSVSAAYLLRKDGTEFN